MAESDHASAHRSASLPKLTGLRPTGSGKPSPMTSRVDRKSCTEKVQLLFTFDSASLAYRRAVSLQMKQIAEFRHESDWPRGVDECRRRVDEARQALISHISEHDC